LNKKAIFLYWLLLLVPTLVVGAVAFRLLAHEQERLERQVLLSTRQRLEAMAEGLRLAAAAAKEGMTAGLLEMPQDRLEESLARWRGANPLVRNVFVWKEGEGLLLPDLDGWLSAEEKRFAARYEALFSGRVPWKSPGEEGGPSSAPPSPAQRAAGPWELGRLARQDAVRPSLPATESMARKEEALAESGWLPWFWENRLHLLGWVRPRPQGALYGVEMEMASLLSRMVADLPEEVPPGWAYVLEDGNGEAMHRMGGGMPDADAAERVGLSLSPHLPHWTLSARQSGDGPPGLEEKGFLVLGSLLLAIFLAAILLGGSMLLWQAHRNLKDALQKTSFVSNVSHELKTPLTNIRMYAEMLASGRVKDPSKRTSYLEVVVSESERLTRLVNNVLDFSRLEQGRKRYRPEEVDLAETAREVLEAQRLRLLEASVSLETRGLEERTTVVTDRDAAGRVLLNLLDNAVKYGCPRRGSPSPADGEDADGPRPAVEADVTVMLRRGEGFAELLVMDRGPGVPRAHRRKIFDTFHRVDDSLTASRPGSGLGLSISRRLLRDLGGDLIYADRPGGGSCFAARFPLEEDHGARAHSRGRG